MKQQTLSVGGFDAYRKTTRKAEFLSRMDLLVPWAEFCSVIEPYYPKAGVSREYIRNLKNIFVTISERPIINS